jgi:hypothetical protein
MFKDQKAKLLGNYQFLIVSHFLLKMEPVIYPSNSSISGNSNKFMSINRDNAGNERKSYTQVVNGGNRITDQIIRKSMPPLNYSNGREMWVPKKAKSLPLPGLIPYMRFASFPAPDPNNWPDSSCLTWFKARGPVEPVKVFSTFKELFSFSGSSQSPNSPALSPSRGTVNPSSSPTLAAAPAKCSAMANIPIDPQPFMPPGFQIQHIEGRTAVHRVVLPRRPRRHEEFAIATIHPMPEGQVLLLTFVMF